MIYGRVGAWQRKKLLLCMTPFSKEGNLSGWIYHLRRFIKVILQPRFGRPILMIQLISDFMEKLLNYFEIIIVDGSGISAWSCISSLHGRWRISMIESFFQMKASLPFILRKKIQRPSIMLTRFHIFFSTRERPIWKPFHSFTMSSTILRSSCENGSLSGMFDQSNMSPQTLSKIKTG